jgi:hypothetical protein
MFQSRTRVCSALLRLMFVVSCGLWSYGIAHAEEHRYRGHEFREHEFRQHEFLDSRFHYDHYYPPRGYAFAVLPPAHRVVVFGGVRYYFAGGVWYRHAGVNFVVVAPPIGVVVPALPPFDATVWVGGLPYYYANSVYYTQSPRGYVVVQEPPSNVIVEQPPSNAAGQQPNHGVVELGPSNAVPPPPPGANIGPGPAGQLFIYPRKGQSQAQQAKDRNACDTWAVSQTGYDPSSQSGNAGNQTDTKLADYQRALGACLDGRGYTVK